MAEPVNKDVTLTVGTEANTVPNTIKDEKTWDEDWAKTFNKNFTNASGKVTINDQGSNKITISKGADEKTSGKLTNNLSSLTLNVGLDISEGGTFVNNGTIEANKAMRMVWIALPPHLEYRTNASSNLGACQDYLTFLRIC